MRAMRHIPVPRGGTGAAAALAAAADAVHAGEGVVFCPEGTLTRDPQMWPMAGRTGIARVALETGCPVIPVAQWGANLLLPPYGKRGRILPRHTHHVLAGPPLDLSRFRGRASEPEVLREVTDEIMGAVTATEETTGRTQIRARRSNARGVSVTAPSWAAAAATLSTQQLVHAEQIQ